MFQFLIDECLSPDLCGEARGRGYHAMHVNFLRMNAYSDHVLAAFSVAEDMVFVTNNGADYRPIYRSIDVHPGLVIIIPSTPRPNQIKAFGAVLDQLGGMRDLINKLIEVDEEGRVEMSDFPPFRDNI